jgi:Flp pilus assembly protein TadB
MAWWTWLLVGWIVLGVTAALALGAAARYIKRREAEDAARLRKVRLRARRESAAGPPRRHHRQHRHSRQSFSAFLHERRDRQRHG